MVDKLLEDEIIFYLISKNLNQKTHLFFNQSC